MNRAFLTRYAWLSVGAALLSITLRTTAYLFTGSVGLFSDALESSVNLVAALLVLAMLTLAARPADEDHAYGYSKAEYFSSGVEGTLLLAAAAGIAVAAVHRLISPRPLERLSIGLLISFVASLGNLAVSLVLLRAGRKHNSISLVADGSHLLTDVWTSAGVLVGVGAVGLTGWQPLDPIVALIVAANIVRTGVGIVHRSASGLMDRMLPAEEQQALQRTLEKYAGEGVQCHALRTRQAAARRFVSLHVLVPGDWTVQRGHQLLERLEADIRSVLPNCTVTTHLESLDDPASWDDMTLDRTAPHRQGPA